MKYDRTTFDYLLKLVLEGKDDITERIISDLSENPNATDDIQFKLCQSVVKRLEGNKIDFRATENAIRFVCNKIKIISDKGDKETAKKILELLLTDKIIGRYYYTLAESLHYTDDLPSTKKVLRLKYEYLKAGIADNEKRTITVETKEGEISQSVFKDVSVADFTKVGFRWIDLCGQTDAFPREVVEFSIPLAESFWDFSELGEFFNILGDTERALEFFRKAEPLITEFEMAFCLVYNLWHKDADRDWAMQAMLKAIKSARSCEDFVRLGEVCGNVNANGISDKELCLVLFSKGQSVALNSNELESLKESLFQVRESWEDEKRGNANGI